MRRSLESSQESGSREAALPEPQEVAALLELQGPNLAGSLLQAADTRRKRAEEVLLSTLQEEGTNTMRRWRAKETMRNIQDTSKNAHLNTAEPRFRPKVG
jgi:hypothetical protein